MPWPTDLNADPNISVVPMGGANRSVRSFRRELSLGIIYYVSGTVQRLQSQFSYVARSALVYMRPRERYMA